MYTFRSEELRRIRNELDGVCSGLHEETLEYKNRGDEDKHRIARMASSHLLSAYLELMNAVDLIEVLEDTE